MKSNKSMPAPIKITEKIAKKLVIGDKLQSKTGKILTVTLIVQKENRTIVLFDGDIEIDFDPYCRLPVVDTI